MSLNGLDVPAVVEAHQSALADPGGWFLLKYANRDTVEILSRGNGGVSEAKGAVEQYTEKSPLYGLLQFRRKKVLLKYVPEGTSRLLQVRLTVQFQSILDAFSHDTVFSFTTASELVESALGQCTMLLPTNAGSLKSSSSSLRQRRLNEITEDTEPLNAPLRKEEPAPAPIRAQPEAPTAMFDVNETSTLPASALRAKAMLAKRKEESRAASQSSIAFQPQPAVTVTATTPAMEASPSISEPPRPLTSLSQLRHPHETKPSISSSKTASTQKELPPKIFHHSRHLSENESESISQWNEQVTAYALQPPVPPPKPKKKLAPRPHVEQTRPKTANMYDDNVPTRQVANLPHSVRVSSRTNTNALMRPGSSQSTRSVPARFLPSPGLPPPMPEFLYQRPESRKAGSIASSAVTDTPNATPEKLRLMKALQNRKRHQVLSSRAASAQSNLTTVHDDFPLDIHPSNVSSAVAALPAPIKEEPPQPQQDIKSAHESSTASPTSIATMSDNPSTRPSSYADEQDAKASQTSASLDTDSSSTPKAVAETAHSNSVSHTGLDEPVLDANDGNYRTNSATPKRFPSMEPIRQRQTEPTVQVKPATPPKGAEPATSWLVHDGINVIQSTVETSEAPVTQRDSSRLGVDKVGSPLTETSSVFSEEDSLAEELRKATVQKATSMSVSRPPLTPTMRTVSHDRTRSKNLSGSNVTPPKSNLSKEVSPQHHEQSGSTALPQLPARHDEDPMAIPLTKKNTLGHGITKRIKALEDSSRRDSTTNSSSLAHDSTIPRSTLSNIIKRNSFIAQFQSTNSGLDKPVSKEAPKSTTDKLLATRPEFLRHDSHHSSATAMRDPPLVELSHSTTQDQEAQNLAKSHLPNLTDNHIVPPEIPSSPSSEKKRFSFTSYRSGTTAKTANAKWGYTESMSSKLSLANKENRAPRTPRSETSSVHEEKRGSRAGRLLKRVSGLGSRFGGKGQQTTASRDELRPDPIIEQNEYTGRAPSVADSSSTMQMIDIGNVNVQFPETLLWKRRFLRIDDQGYLIFSAPTDHQAARANNRKFHLADIQEPCLPDAEREEIAWSVLLDLRDGNCIQCACASKREQSHVLKMLLDAHYAYHSLYSDSLE